jgi:hypothetical protein
MATASETVAPSIGVDAQMRAGNQSSVRVVAKTVRCSVVGAVITLNLPQKLTAFHTEFTNTFANFYPCEAGFTEPISWVCGDPLNPSFNVCSSSNQFKFHPGRPLLPDFNESCSNNTSEAVSDTTSNAVSNAISSDKSCQPIKLRVGLGVGLSLGLALLAVAAVLGYLLRKTQKRNQQNATNSIVEKRANDVLQNRSWVQPKQPLSEVESHPSMPEMEGC